MLSGRDLNGGALVLAQLELHVRLTGREPDIPNQHVVKLYRIVRLNRDLLGTPSRQRRKVNGPASQVVGPGGLSPAFERHGYLLSGIGFSPDMDRTVALQPHVIGKQPGQRDIRPGASGGQ